MMAGDVKSAFKGRGMELEEIRSYAYGDDVRDIDWRVTARKEQPFTKLYAEERDREIYVLLDLSPQMVFGTRHELKSVAAAKIAALLGWMSLENKDRFGCVVYDGQENLFFKPQNNRANMMIMLKKIPNGFCVKNRRFLPICKSPYSCCSRVSKARQPSLLSAILPILAMICRRVWRLWLKKRESMP